MRWAESNRRKRQRGIVELNSYTKQAVILNNDNTETRRLFETCTIKSKHVINPVIDWTDAEVWEFIRLRNLDYCCLYDRGFSRLGCIGCPMAGGPKMKWEFEQYPKYKAAYIRAFDRMIQHRIETGLRPIWISGQHVFDWWVGDFKFNSVDETQLSLFEQ